MKLYLDYLYLSPYTYTVFSALREKTIPFEMVEVTFEKSTSLDHDFANRCPTDLIPLLDDEGFRLSESLAILEYIDERFTNGTSLLPKDLKKRAQARQLLSWYRCGMKALREERSTETIYYPEHRSKKPLSDEARDEVRELTTFLSPLVSSGNGFLFGSWSIADQESALMLQRLIANGDPIDPHLKKYAQAIWQRPVSQEWISKKRKPFKSYYK